MPKRVRKKLLGRKRKQCDKNSKRRIRKRQLAKSNENGEQPMIPEGVRALASANEDLFDIIDDFDYAGDDFGDLNT